jgi:phage tail-like protein
MIPSATGAALAAPKALLGAAKPAKVSTPGPGGVPIPEYGITMWFRVTVGLQSGDLGQWSSCDGLGVDFDHKDVGVGGVYDRQMLVPVGVKYREISLSRAMTTTTSGQVRSWLEHVTAQWINSPEGGAPQPRSGGGNRFHPGTTMTIELYHKLDQAPVASWTLRDVVPKSWSAPSLSSTNGSVAMETLVLSHGGFLTAGTDSASSGVTEGGQGLLTLSGPGAAPVHFQYNPRTVTATRSVNVDMGGRQGSEESDPQVTHVGSWSVDYGELLVEGEQAVHAATNSLSTWTEPDATINGATPRTLLVRLGDGRNLMLTRRIVLTYVKISYTRFTRTGAPCRAEVTLTMQGVEPLRGKGGTSPSTGGAVSQKSQGKSLPSMSNDAKGSPGQWRDTAKANDVDDPLRVPNGTRLRMGGHR